jgi:hypothetical protein
LQKDKVMGLTDHGPGAVLQRVPAVIFRYFDYCRLNGLSLSKHSARLHTHVERPQLALGAITLWSA